MKSNVRVFDSKILKGGLNLKLAKLCEFEARDKWSLLYRASEHGFTAQAFHSKCDNVANTLTVVKTTKGYIFGGFAQQPLRYTNYDYNYYPTQSNICYIPDSSAFIFSLINKESSPIKMKIIAPQYAIACAANNGPTFGAGPDFCIFASKEHQNPKLRRKMLYVKSHGLFNEEDNQSENEERIPNQPTSHSNFGSTYQHPAYSHGTTEAKCFLAGSDDFQVYEVEVFQKL
jgi:hypothetical protein